MKKCPFCAEEIKDEAIKCRYCGSFLRTAAPAASSDRAPDAGEAAGATKPSPEREPDAPGEREAKKSQPDGLSDDDQWARPEIQRRELYRAYPSWRAYFKLYAVVVLATAAAAVLGGWLGSEFEVATLVHTLLAAIPLGAGLIAFAAVTFHRRSKIVRVSTTSIETERGILAKKIDVLELWRCRDIRYRQSFADRLLGISHIEIFTEDSNAPQLEFIGLPASRRLFEKLRDAIEVQKQSRSAHGMAGT